MLVGDYCPRALDPVFDIVDAEKELALAKQAMDVLTEAAIKDAKKRHVQARPVHEEEAELPCNVFGTVDRCDGMACEHDGNCFSGCCSLFVSGDQKRCMPLVGGDMCPIAIDVVEKFQIVGEDVKEPLHEEVAEEFDSPLHYVDHKELNPLEEEAEDILIEHRDDDDLLEDHPIVEKGEHHADYDLVIDAPEHDYVDADHVIPAKTEHYMGHEDGISEDLIDEEDFENAEHVIPEKSEHHDDVRLLPKDVWRPDFHAREEETHLIDHENETNEEKDLPKLKPKEPKKDDPRLKIPKGKATAAHDHAIVPKEPVPTAEHKPIYGQAYEHDRKSAIKGERQSAGLAPKQPIKHEESSPMQVHEVHRKPSRKPCSAYGNSNKCEGMTCKSDNECASSCCGAMTSEGQL